MQSNAEMTRYNYLISEIESVYHEAALRFGFSDSAMMTLYVLSGQGELSVERLAVLHGAQ